MKVSSHIKVGVILLFTVIIGIGIFQINKLYNKIETVQIENILLKDSIGRNIELEKQKQFLIEEEKIDSVIIEKIKLIDEIQKNIKSPVINFNDSIIQDSIKSVFRNRFPKN